MNKYSNNKIFFQNSLIEKRMKEIIKQLAIEKEQAFKIKPTAEIPKR